jgi:hypothetical protein
MKNTRVSTAERVLPFSAQEIWSVITNNDDYSWRRDITRIEKISEKEFIEYGKNYEIEFEVTKLEEPNLYEFNMIGSAFQGVWIGRLTELSEKSTRLVFTEELEFKNPIMKLLSFIMLNVKKIQEQYFDDLETYLYEREKNRYGCK